MDVQSSDRYIVSCYEQVQAKVLADLATARYISLAVDWTTRSHIISTAFITDECELKSYALAYDEVDLVPVISKLCDEWEIDDDKIVSITTRPLDIHVSKDYWKNRHIPCIAHELNAVAGSSLTSYYLHKKVRAIVDLFLAENCMVENCLAALRLKQCQKEENEPETPLKSDHPERTWRATVEMLRSTIKAITSCLLKHYPGKNGFKAVDEIYMNKVIALLSIFETIAKTITAESETSPNISTLIVIVEETRSHMETVQQDKTTLPITVSDLFCDIQGDLDQRFEGKEAFEFSTLLDPRYKTIAFRDQKMQRRSLSRNVVRIPQSLLHRTMFLRRGTSQSERMRTTDHLGPSVSSKGRRTW